MRPGLRPSCTAIVLDRGPSPEVPVARSRSSLAMLAVVPVLVVGLAWAAVTTGTAAATSAPDDATRGVTVSGTGTASGPPDVLRFTVGVQVTAPGVDAAMASANAAQDRVLAVLRQRGVEDRDVQTASVRLEPRYDAEGQAITGYTVSEDVRVAVRDLATAGATISAAVAAGGDAARLSGVQLVLEDDDALRVQAREEAFAEARAKAEQYAELAGRELGAVQTVVEDVRPTGQPWQERAFDTAASAAVPLAPGSAEVGVDVQVRWALR